MSLASTVSSFYQTTYGFIQDMVHLKLASEGGLPSSSCLFLVVFKTETYFTCNENLDLSQTKKNISFFL